MQTAGNASVPMAGCALHSMFPISQTLRPVDRGGPIGVNGPSRGISTRATALPPLGSFGPPLGTKQSLSIFSICPSDRHSTYPYFTLCQYPFGSRSYPSQTMMSLERDERTNGRKYRVLHRSS